MKNKNKLQGKNVLELGSGVGLTGLAIINYCSPKTYYFSDFHPLVLKTLRENVQLNLFNKTNLILWNKTLSKEGKKFEKVETTEDKKAKIINLNWEDIDKLNLDQMNLDLVIAADVLFDNSTFKFLVRGLKNLLNKTVDYAIVAATIRNKLTTDEFLDYLGTKIICN